MHGDEDGTAARLWSMAGLGTPMAIRVAATLRLADHIDRGARTAPGLAEATGADPAALERLLRYLAVRGVLARDEGGGFSVTALGAPLRSGHPARVRDWFDIDGMGWGELSFVELLHTVRTGEAAFQRRYGRSYWDDLAADPARSASFDDLLGADVAARAPGVVAGFDWGKFDHVVDVGGGDGSLLTALLHAHPGVRGTVVDLPATASAAVARFEVEGLAGRAGAVAGSFFDPLPAGGDGYVLSLVLHDWDDESSVAVLRRCAEAAGDGGRVLVIESITAADDTHTGMDLRMMCLYGAGERGVAELAELGERAGLRVAGVHPAGPSTIVEFVAG